MNQGDVGEFMKKTFLVIGSGSFSGSDFVDLLLDDPNHRVTGISRSPERSEVFMPYRHHKSRENFRFFQLDLNKNIG